MVKVHADFDNLKEKTSSLQRQSWEALARQLPNRDVATRIEDPDRQFDREKDRMPHVGRYPDLNDEFREDMKTNFPADITARSSASPEGLERTLIMISRYADDSQS